VLVEIASIGVALVGVALAGVLSALFRNNGLFVAIHWMKSPTSLTTAPGTPSFCAHIGRDPLASLAVAMIHSILRSGSILQRSILVYALACNQYCEQLGRQGPGDTR